MRARVRYTLRLIRCLFAISRDVDGLELFFTFSLLVVQTAVQEPLCEGSERV